MVSFVPTFTIWLAANDRPKVNAQDRAFWRRIVELPFPHSFEGEEKDPAIKDEILDPERGGPGILAWLVAGCREYLVGEKDLEPPKSVRAATSDYRKEVDTIEGFLDDMCVLEDNVTTVRSDLYPTYRTHCKRTGEKTMGRNKFNNAMREKGFDEIKTDGIWYWIGVRILVRNMGDSN